MTRAVQGLAIQPEFVQVDGNRLPNWSYPAEAIVQGDGSVACISAASIIAKVVRDREMLALDEIYPEYGFAKHKGYPTKAHLACLAELPILPNYRRSFKPIARLLEAKQK